MGDDSNDFASALDAVVAIERLRATVNTALVDVPNASIINAAIDKLARLHERLAWLPLERVDK
jgi:hypothetical protein